MFPVGGLIKPRVKEIANEIGLSRIAKRNEVSFLDKQISFELCY